MLFQGRNVQRTLFQRVNFSLFVYLNDCFSGGEIRSYLNIIEELTEDKLLLEKTVSDVQADKEMLNNEVKRLTDSYVKIETDLAQCGSVKEMSLKAAKEESRFLLQNIQSLEQENSVLEENLLKLREDKTEILDNLRQAQEDRFGFIRTMQMLTEQKEAVDDECTELKAKNKELTDKLSKQGKEESVLDSLLEVVSVAP